jgi:hypothetical protein
MTHEREVQAVRDSLIGRTRDIYQRRPRPDIPSRATQEAATRVADARAYLELARPHGGVRAEEAAAELSAAKYALAVALRDDHRAMRGER